MYISPACSSGECVEKPEERKDAFVEKASSVAKRCRRATRRDVNEINATFGEEPRPRQFEEVVDMREITATYEEELSPPDASSRSSGECVEKLEERKAVFVEKATLSGVVVPERDQLDLRGGAAPTGEGETKRQEKTSSW